MGRPTRTLTPSRSPSQDCGVCYNCADRKIYGGPGIRKQACVRRGRCAAEAEVHKGRKRGRAPPKSKRAGSVGGDRVSFFPLTSPPNGDGLAEAGSVQPPPPSSLVSAPLDPVLSFGRTDTLQAEFIEVNERHRKELRAQAVLAFG